MVHLSMFVQSAQQVASELAPILTEGTISPTPFSQPPRMRQLVWNRDVVEALFGDAVTNRQLGQHTSKK